MFFFLNSGYMVGKYYLVKCGGELCPGRVSFRMLRFHLNEFDFCRYIECFAFC